MATGAQLPLRAGRRVHAQGGSRARACPRARSASSSPASRKSDASEGRRHRHARRHRPAAARCRVSRTIKPQVFAGLYPVESNQYEALRDALDKLQAERLQSLHYEPEISQALGFGFRCGFLGLLHMDIVQERLEREYDMDLITTAPTVVYQVLLRDGTVIEIENPSKPARPLEGRGDPRADHHGDDPDAAGVRGTGADAVHREARRAEEHALRRPAGDADLRPAAGRGGDGLLRQAEDRCRAATRRSTTSSSSSGRPTWSSSTS